MMANYTRSHVKNPFLTPWDRNNQHVVDLLDMEAQRAWTPIGA
jgi:lambda repressor-like predicted transcriptional regulator